MLLIGFSDVVLPPALIYCAAAQAAVSRQDRASRGLGLAAGEVADEVELPNRLCAGGDAPRGVPPAAQRLPAQGPCGAPPAP